MEYGQKSLELCANSKGKLSVISKVAVNTREDLSVVYTPGVAEPCRRIADNKHDVYKYTIKSRTVAIVSDGTAVLGLGTSVQKRRCRLWKGKQFCLRNLGE